MKKEKEERKKGRRILRRLIGDMKSIRGWLILASCISLCAVAFSIAAPEILGGLTNKLYELWVSRTAIEAGGFIKSCIILAAVYAGASGCETATMFIMNNVVSRQFTCVLRIRISDKIKRLPVKFVDDTPKGEIISRMTNDVSVLGNTVHNFLYIIIMGFLKIAGILAVLFIMQPVMAIGVAVLMPAAMFFSVRIAQKSMKYYDQVRETNGKLYALTEEDYTGFDTVKAFNLEERQRQEHAKLCEEKREKLEKGIYLSELSTPVVGFANSISFILICLIGGYFAIRGIIGVGEVVAFVLYSRMFAGPLENITHGFSMMQNTIASAGRVYDLLDREEMSAEEGKNPNGEGNVTFEHVSFSYDAEKPLIQDLNITVSAGQKAAIVGPTGGGKTTIVNLLMRFYDADSGRILLDGQDIREMDRAELRSAFSMVLQDTWLFSGTIFENIAYGKPGASKEEVYEAARRAHLDYFIDTLKDGYDTMINEESSNISSGQKQLMTIARAYLADRSILILDEATSNVDTRTEILIQNTMDELMQGRTSFVIAHRLSTIVDADVILVVDGGRIVEQGRHEELLARNGFYAEIYNSQYELLK